VVAFVEVLGRRSADTGLHPRPVAGPGATAAYSTGRAPGNRETPDYL